MDETLSMEDQWLDIILKRFTDNGCQIDVCLREEANQVQYEHIIYQTREGQLQHALFRYQGLEEPVVVVTEKLVMARPPKFVRFVPA